VGEARRTDNVARDAALARRVRIRHVHYPLMTASPRERFLGTCATRSYAW
jgi:hypothetical protein